jgi:ribosomal protein S15
VVLLGRVSSHATSTSLSQRLAAFQLYDFPSVHGDQKLTRLTVLSLLQSLPVAPSYAKNGICATCSYSFSAKGPMTYKNQHKSKLKPHRNPYRDAQAKQRKAANQARQKMLQEQRTTALGDPVRSNPTPFIQSLSTGRLPGEPTKEELRNFFLGPNELAVSLEYSKKLSAPYIPRSADITNPAEAAPSPAEVIPATTEKVSPSSDPPILPIERGDTTLPPPLPTNHYIRPKAGPTTRQLTAFHESLHNNATRALGLISSLTNGSSSNLTRHNIQRCISTFGRHSTDTALPPRPSSIYNTNPSPPKLRAGPDTGSSEVQIAVLTTKINVLADNLYKKDKLNKRNLRLMVHKRQKLLTYLRSRERAGPRWRNLVENLGITDAMWKGEISL